MRDSKTPKNDHLRPFNTERKFSDKNKTNHQDSKNQNSNSELSHLMKKELLQIRLSKKVKESTLKTSLLNSVCKQLKGEIGKRKTFSKRTTMASAFLETEETKDLLKKGRETERSLVETETIFDKMFESQGLKRSATQSSFFKTGGAQLSEIQKMYIKGIESPRRVSKHFQRQKTAVKRPIQNIKNKEFSTYIANNFRPANIQKLQTFQKYAFDYDERNGHMYNDSLKKIRESNKSEILNGFVNSELWTKKIKYQVLKQAGFQSDKESLKRYIYAKRGVRQGRARMSKKQEKAEQDPLVAMDEFKDNFVKNMRIAENPQNMFTAGINFKFDQEGNSQYSGKKDSESAFTKNLIVSRNSFAIKSPLGIQKKVIDILKGPRASMIMNRRSYLGRNVSKKK